MAIEKSIWNVLEMSFQKHISEFYSRKTLSNMFAWCHIQLLSKYCKTGNTQGQSVGENSGKKIMSV